MALTMKELQEMEVGDFIVHVDFGIGTNTLLALRSRNLIMQYMGGIAYRQKLQKNLKKVLTDWFYSGILTELSRRIVSSE